MFQHYQEIFQPFLSPTLLLNFDQYQCFLTLILNIMKKRNKYLLTNIGELTVKHSTGSQGFFIIMVPNSRFSFCLFMVAVCDCQMNVPLHFLSTLPYLLLFFCHIKLNLSLIFVPLQLFLWLNEIYCKEAAVYEWNAFLNRDVEKCSVLEVGQGKVQ